MKKVLQRTQRVAKKIENIFESSGDNLKLQKITKEFEYPANLLNLKFP